jgi:hypothetical protein
MARGNIWLAPSFARSGQIPARLLLWRSWRSVLHVLPHAGFASGLEVFQLGLLIGSQHLEELVVNARSLDSQLKFDLSLLRGQSAHLGFVEGTLRILVKLLIDLVRATAA